MNLAQSYTLEAFEELIKRETDRVELKTGVSRDKVSEAVVAFSNTEGGVIFVGVTDDRRVTGQSLTQGVHDKIHQAIHDARDCGRYEIMQISVAGTPVVAITVHRREEGFAQTSNGRVLVRHGARNDALFGSEMWDFVSGRSLRRFESADSNTPVTEAEQGYLDELALVHGWSELNPEGLRQRLTERGLVLSNGNMTIAGALFLTDPAQSLGVSKAFVEVRRYPEVGGEYDRRVVFDGPLQQQVVDALSFIMGELGSDLVVTGLYRYDLPRLPEVVVREAVANAVAHRSYEAHRTAVLVEMRPDGVLVTSPGGLPEPVTIQNLRQAQTARNPTVIDVLRRFSLAEDAGRGIDVMEDQMAEALLDPPQFQDENGFVSVFLPLRGAITARERAWVQELERRGTLEASDKILLVQAARGSELTNAVARSALSTEDSGLARKALHRLRDNGLLEQHGERGGATYTLSASIAPPAAYRLTPTQLRDMLVERAAEAPLTNESVRQFTGLDRQDTRVLLKQLVASGRLRQLGERRGTRYVLPGE
ncbi:hypothetical protein GCU67_19855 [Modestobacter muralis]|uniref:Schlafen AlbA-2 domain-containing protein n=1 Tax=Modestobacter muralis TaxID=1608614 RepID=A0A6P0HC35_9ACTN|nr:hypothetical protein [Modestobacter muralis]NEN53302.1 hypothetical protein [Modestobacter muralis]